MKQILILAPLAGFAAEINNVLDRKEGSWKPGPLTVTKGMAATVLELKPGHSHQTSGTIYQTRVLTGDSKEVNAELAKLQGENPYWRVVSTGIESETLVRPAAKKAAKKTARKTAANAASNPEPSAATEMEVIPRFKLVALVALHQP